MFLAAGLFCALECIGYILENALQGILEFFDLRRRKIAVINRFHLFLHPNEIRLQRFGFVRQVDQYFPAVDFIPVPPLEGMRPTRDILYVQGETQRGDTLHVFVVHAPSRYGGERATRPNRRLVADRLLAAIRLYVPQAGGKVLVCGDFNDYADSPALLYLQDNGLYNVTATARGLHGAPGTYRYDGRWQSIDHVLVSALLRDSVRQVFINDAPFLVEEDKRYGGVKPFRTFNGYRYQRGFSDHLPLVVRF